LDQNSEIHNEHNDIKVNKNHGPNDGNNRL
jgi:hypothetical protein